MDLAHVYLMAWESEMNTEVFSLGNPIYTYTALDSKVLVVMTKGVVNDYSCYIGAVEGKEHEFEAKEVARKGTKLSFRIAKAIFPNLTEELYRL